MWTQQISILHTLYSLNFQREIKPGMPGIYQVKVLIFPEYKRMEVHVKTEHADTFFQILHEGFVHHMRQEKSDRFFKSSHMDIDKRNSSKGHSLWNQNVQKIFMQVSLYYCGFFSHKIEFQEKLKECFSLLNAVDSKINKIPLELIEKYIPEDTISLNNKMTKV